MQFDAPLLLCPKCHRMVERPKLFHRECYAHPVRAKVPYEKPHPDKDGMFGDDTPLLRFPKTRPEDEKGYSR